RAPHADQAVPDGLEADRRRRQHLRQREPVPRRDPSAHAREAPVARTLRPACRRPQGNLARRDPRRRLEPARLRRSRRQPGLFPAALLGVRTRGPALQAMRERDPPHRAGAALYFFLPALSALAAPAFSRFSTTGSTNFDTSPPSVAISRTSVAEMNMCCSEGVRKMVSKSGSRLRFMPASWNSYSKSDTARRPRSTTRAPCWRPKSISRPEQPTTSTLFMSPSTSRAIATRSSRLKNVRFALLSATA